MEELTASQKRAEKLITEWFCDSKEQIFVLAGYAGTGKTFLINHIVTERLKLVPDVSAMFVTPTGKAATVILRRGTKACTLHRLIYQAIDEEYVVFVNDKPVKRRRVSFFKKPEIDKAIKLIIVDEVSMVSDRMLADLLSYGVKCLLCGDTAQLPPVGGTNTLLQTPDFTLTDIVRQEKDNPIVQAATMVRNGETLPLGKIGDNVHVLSTRRISPAGVRTAQDRKKMFLNADQVIVGRNSTRARINREIRGYLGYDVTNPLPQENEKIICTLNNWGCFLDYDETFNLVNGVVGRCTDVRRYGYDIGQMNFQAEFLDEIVPDLTFDMGVFLRGEYTYDFGQEVIASSDGSFYPLNPKQKIDDEDSEILKLNRFELAHAITCHKAQGSEFDYVAVFDESRVFADSHRWLYTAITRAKKRLLIVRE